MSTENEQLAREGYEALLRGEFERLEQLMAPDLRWYGREPGPGDCDSREEALGVIRERAAQGAIGELREVSSIDANRVLVVIGLNPDSALAREELGLAPEHEEVASVVTIEGGKVAAMQDYRSKAEALAPPLAPTGREWRVHDLVPFLHVADIARSIAFYEELGLTVRDTFAPEGETVWAHLQSAHAQVMLAEGEGPVEGDREAILFYLYSENLAELRERLIAAGIPASEIVDGSPGPRHEMRVADPDGYCLMVAQSEEEGERT